jgi:hypothetical protein
LLINIIWANDVPRAINAKFKGAAFLLRMCILSAVDISAVDEIQASVPAPLRATKKKKNFKPQTPSREAMARTGLR